MDALSADGLFADICAFEENFSRRYARLARRYGLRWGNQRVMHQWSRRWEYPYVAQRIADLAARAPTDAPLAILDAGSGITFLPYYLRARYDNVQISCVDSAGSYRRTFDRINRAAGEGVTFTQAMLQDVPLESAGFDAIYCVSVLEHTGDYAAVLDEMHRLLRPGGKVILTFDISLDGKDDISPELTRQLLTMVAQRFELPAGFDCPAELDRLAEPMAILSTDAAKAADPSSLPWKWPVLKSIRDLLTGHGWTGGFFSLACYCLEASKPANGG